MLCWQRQTGCLKGRTKRRDKTRLGADNFEPEMTTDDQTRNVRSRILQQAEICICGEREQDYGSPENNFAIIAEMWSAYTGTKITPLDVAMMMCLLKIARIKSGGGSGDSFVDLAGYAACGGEIREGMKR